MDSCYLCEIGQEGLLVPYQGQTILVCAECTLKAIFSHPKLTGAPDLSAADADAINDLLAGLELASIQQAR